MVDYDSIKDLIEERDEEQANVDDFMLQPAKLAVGAD